jgi:hypothetical protein
MVPVPLRLQWVDAGSASPVCFQAEQGAEGAVGPGAFGKKSQPPASKSY